MNIRINALQASQSRRLFNQVKPQIVFIIYWSSGTENRNWTFYLSTTLSDLYLINYTFRSCACFSIDHIEDIHAISFRFWVQLICNVNGMTLKWWLNVKADLHNFPLVLMSQGMLDVGWMLAKLQDIKLQISNMSKELIGELCTFHFRLKSFFHPY